MSLTVADLVGYMRIDKSQWNRELAAGEKDVERSRGWVSALGTGAKVAGVGLLTMGIAGAKTGLQVAGGMQNAEIAFSTMLGSGEKARAFLGELQAFAAKTPFEFPELQTAASSLISAGFEASQVIPIMTTLGDVTSGMGTGADGVKRATVALQQMRAAGRITGEDLNQLRDAGVPVFDLLAAATGKSKEEIAALAQQGKLGREEMEQLFAALESGKGLERFGGLMAAQSATMTGAWSTFMDALRMGLAQSVMPIVPVLSELLPKAAEKLTAAFAWLAPRVQAAVTWFRAGTTEGGHLRTRATEISDAVSRVVDRFRDAAGEGEGLTGVWAGIKAALDGVDWDQVAADGGEVVNMLRETAPAVREAMADMPSFNDVLRVGAEVLGWLAENSDVVAKALPYLAAGFVLVKTAQLAANVASAVAPGLRIAEMVANRRLAASNVQLTAAIRAQTIATGQAAAATTGSTAAKSGGILASVRAAATTVAHTVAEKARAVATKAGAAAQWLLNAAMTANPIGLIIAAVLALGAALVVAWNKSETFRKIVTAAWEWIKGAAMAVADWFTVTIPALWDQIYAWTVEKIGAVRDWLATTWSAVTGAVGAAKDGIVTAWDTAVEFVTGIPGRIAGALTGMWSFITTEVGEMKDAAVEKAEQLVTWFKNLPGQIVGAVAGLGYELYATGREIISELWDGIKEKWEQLVDWFLDRLDWFTGLWPFSPAKHGPLRQKPPQRWGANVAGLIADGLRSQTGQVERAAGGLAAAALPDTGLRATPAAAVLRGTRAASGADLERVVDRIAAQARGGDGASAQMTVDARVFNPVEAPGTLAQMRSIDRVRKLGLLSGAREVRVVLSPAGG